MVSRRDGVRVRKARRVAACGLDTDGLTVEVLSIDCTCFDVTLGRACPPCHAWDVIAVNIGDRKNTFKDLIVMDDGLSRSILGLSMTVDGLLMTNDSDKVW